MKICRQQVVANRSRNAQKARSNRLLHNLENKAEQERHRADRYKKRYQRLLKKLSKSTRQAETPILNTGQLKGLSRQMNA